MMSVRNKPDNKYAFEKCWLETKTADNVAEWSEIHVSKVETGVKEMELLHRRA